MTAQAVTEGLLAYLAHGPRPLLMVQLYLQRHHAMSAVEANRTVLIALKYRRVETHGSRAIFVRAVGDLRRWPRQTPPRPSHRGPGPHPALRNADPAVATFSGATA